LDRQTLADTQDKHSHSRAQGTRRRAQATTQTASPKAKRSPHNPPRSPRKHRSPKKRKKPKKPERLPASLRFTETRQGKTTIRRHQNRSFHRLEEVAGKTVEYVEIFTSGEYHSISVRFQDKTCLHFVIDPGFTLDTEYDDWKTGDLRRIKRWPLIHSESLRS
jgi:hypothetical protein